MDVTWKRFRKTFRAVAGAHVYQCLPNRPLFSKTKPKIVERINKELSFVKENNAQVTERKQQP